MSKPLPTDAEWAHVRRLWETTPRMTYGDVGRLLGVSRQAAAQRGAKEGWVKEADLSAISRKAHAQADAGSPAPAGLHAPKDAVVASSLQQLRSDPKFRQQLQDELRQAARQAADEVVKQQVEAAEKTAVELRAKLLESHRKEWMSVRAIVWDAINRRDFERAKLGKITSEAMRIIQKGERKAWGLDLDEKDKAAPGEPTRLVIERREMKL